MIIMTEGGISDIKHIETRILLNILQCTECPTAKNDSIQNDHSIKIENLCYRYLGEFVSHR